jgi:hypothetical protein
VHSGCEDLTWEECEAYHSLAALRGGYNLREEYGSAEELLAACREQRCRPYLKQLVGVARGSDLIAFCASLRPSADELARLAGLKEKRRVLEQERREAAKKLNEALGAIDNEIAALEGEDEEDDKGGNDGDDKEDKRGDRKVKKLKVTPAAGVAVRLDGAGSLAIQFAEDIVTYEVPLSRPQAEELHDQLTAALGEDDEHAADPLP